MLDIKLLVAEYLSKIFEKFISFRDPLIPLCTRLIISERISTERTNYVVVVELLVSQ
jgi:hypothetical protein